MEDIVNYIRQATMESKLVVEKYLKDYPQLPIKELIKLILDDRAKQRAEAIRKSLLGNNDHSPEL